MRFKIRNPQTIKFFNSLTPRLVAELTDNIKVKRSSDSEESEEEGTYFANYFPSLFVVLRDFFLELKINGKEVNRILETQVENIEIEGVKRTSKAVIFSHFVAVTHGSFT